MNREKAIKILNKIVKGFESLDSETQRKLIGYFCACYGWVQPE